MGIVALRLFIFTLFPVLMAWAVIRIDRSVTSRERKKVEIARANFKEAGLRGFVELREGDLRQTLQDVGGPVDLEPLQLVYEQANQRWSSRISPTNFIGGSKFTN